MPKLSAAVDPPPKGPGVTNATHALSSAKKQFSRTAAQKSASARTRRRTTLSPVPKPFLGGSDGTSMPCAPKRRASVARSSSNSEKRRFATWRSTVSSSSSSASELRSTLAADAGDRGACGRTVSRTTG